MTIIIETPQPPIRERLVLVREGEPMAPRRDAEPADLERAGWVRDSDLLALTVRAEAAEAERDEARDTIARARGCITDVPAGVRNALDIEVARLLRERDEARAERDKLDAKLAQAEERGDLADQRAIDAIAERDEARQQRDAEIASRDALARVLEQVERERDEARCLYEAAHCERMRITDVLQRVERERDEARAALATMTRQRDDALQVLGQAREALPSDMRGGWLVDAVRRLVRERDEARAALATMTRQRDDATALAARLRCDLDRATDREDGVAAERARIVAIVREDARRLRLSWPTIADAMLALADRLERGEHADTPVPAAEPRATDEELVGLFDAAASRRAAVAAVAARVRREQCLVTRAVEAGALFSIRPYVCKWIVIASHGGNDRRETVPAADVPKTLARLLGEVTRG